LSHGHARRDRLTAARERAAGDIELRHQLRSPRRRRESQTLRPGGDPGLPLSRRAEEGDGESPGAPPVLRSHVAKRTCEGRLRGGSREGRFGPPDGRPRFGPSRSPYVLPSQVASRANGEQPVCHAEARRSLTHGNAYAPKLTLIREDLQVGSQ